MMQLLEAVKSVATDNPLLGWLLAIAVWLAVMTYRYAHSKLGVPANPSQFTTELLNAMATPGWELSPGGAARSPNLQMNMHFDGSRTKLRLFTGGSYRETGLPKGELRLLYRGFQALCKRLKEEEEARARQEVLNAIHNPTPPKV